MIRPAAEPETPSSRWICGTIGPEDRARHDGQRRRCDQYPERPSKLRRGCHWVRFGRRSSTGLRSRRIGPSSHGPRSRSRPVRDRGGDMRGGGAGHPQQGEKVNASTASTFLTTSRDRTGSDRGPLVVRDLLETLDEPSCTRTLPSNGPPCNSSASSSALPRRGRREDSFLRD